jgi:predicted regulator of Ras-like GTPase activity (Roadblock/LC7/MglB family)
MSKLSNEEAAQLSAYLSEITNHTDLDAIGLVSREGLRLAYSAVEGYEVEPDLLAAMTAVILQAGHDSVVKLGFDRLLEVVLRGKKSFMVVSAAGRFFLVGASLNVKELAKIVAVFRFYAGKIAERYPDT